MQCVGSDREQVLDQTLYFAVNTQELVALLVDRMVMALVSM